MAQNSTLGERKTLHLIACNRLFFQEQNLPFIELPRAAIEESNLPVESFKQAQPMIFL